jgi:hypothetical protein
MKDRLDQDFQSGIPKKPGRRRRWTCSPFGGAVALGAIVLTSVRSGIPIVSQPVVPRVHTPYLRIANGRDAPPIVGSRPTSGLPEQTGPGDRFTVVARPGIDDAMIVTAPSGLDEGMIHEPFISRARSSSQIPTPTEP